MRKEKITLFTISIILLLVSTISSALWLYHLVDLKGLEHIIENIKTPIFIRALCSISLVAVGLFVGVGFTLKSTIGSFDKKSIIGMFISIIFIIIGMGLILGDQKDAYFGPFVTNYDQVLFPKSVSNLGNEYLWNSYQPIADWYNALLFPISITFLCVLGPIFMWMADHIFKFHLTLQNNVQETGRGIPSPVEQIITREPTKPFSRQSTESVSIQPIKPVTTDDTTSTDIEDFESETAILKRETTLTREQKEEIEQTAIHERLMNQRNKRK